MHLGGGGGGSSLLYISIVYYIKKRGEGVQKALKLRMHLMEGPYRDIIKITLYYIGYTMMLYIT